MPFRRNRPEIGSRPGTLAIPAGSPPPQINVVRYDAESVSVTDVKDPDELKELRDAGGVSWIDIQGLGDETVLRRIADVFELGPLVLEDAVNVPQRAKSEMYDAFHMIIARMPTMSDEGAVNAPQVCFLVGTTWLITFQERYFGFFEPVRDRIRAGIGPIRRLGPDYLAYALIDTLIDRYYPIAEELSNSLDDIESLLAEEPDAVSLADIQRIRRQLAVLRRVGRPQREAINALVREPSPFVSDDVRGFLRDTADHVAQIMDLLDSSREVATALSESFLANMSHKSNEIMKVLTLMASIFIPLTFIAGIYGMNFEYMPELRQRGAYFVVLAVMVAVAAGMLLLFIRRGWIRRPRSRRGRR